MSGHMWLLLRPTLPHRYRDQSGGYQHGGCFGVICGDQDKHGCLQQNIRPAVLSYRAVWMRAAGSLDPSRIPQGLQRGGGWGGCAGLSYGVSPLNRRLPDG